MENESEKLFYEYGFTCGGILTVGYCQFLNRLAREKEIDRFLFVARDGDVIRKIYRRYFWERENEYLIFSRFASAELIFDTDPVEYFEENIRPRIDRIGTDNSMGKVLEECGISALEEYLPEAGLTRDEVLTTENQVLLRDMILKHKSEVQNIFEESCRAAQEYILEQVGSAGRICVVDIGWRGKSVIYLKKLLEQQYRWDGQVFGALIGADGNFITQDYIRRGVVIPFAFPSPLSRRHGITEAMMPVDEVICMEALFSSEADTLLRYAKTAFGEVTFLYGQRNENKEKVRSIHQGIEDFCKQFVPIIQKYDLTVTAQDAWAPLEAAMRNKKYRKMIRDAYKEVPGAMNGF